LEKISAPEASLPTGQNLTLPGRATYQLILEGRFNCLEFTANKKARTVSRVLALPFFRLLFLKIFDSVFIYN
jgi:hypothetical protein